MFSGALSLRAGASGDIIPSVAMAAGTLRRGSLRRVTSRAFRARGSPVETPRLPFSPRSSRLRLQAGGGRGGLGSLGSSEGTDGVASAASTSGGGPGGLRTRTGRYHEIRHLPFRSGALVPLLPRGCVGTTPNRPPGVRPGWVVGRRSSPVGLPL